MANPERKDNSELNTILQVSVEVVQNKTLKGRLPLELQVTLAKKIYLGLKEYKATEEPNTPWDHIDMREAYSDLQKNTDEIQSKFAEAGYNPRSANKIYRNACLMSLRMLGKEIYTYEEYRKYLKYPRKHKPE